MLQCYKHRIKKREKNMITIQIFSHKSINICSPLASEPATQGPWPSKESGPFDASSWLRANTLSLSRREGSNSREDERVASSWVRNARPAPSKRRPRRHFLRPITSSDPRARYAISDITFATPSRALRHARYHYVDVASITMTNATPSLRVWYFQIFTSPRLTRPTELCNDVGILTERFVLK